MKIFVTGGAGFIGSNFIRCAVNSGKGYSILNFDKLTYAGNLANLADVANDPSYAFIRGDICDISAVESAMSGCDAVVHFAAESHVDRSIYEPAAAIETNVKGTFVLLQVARKLKISKFVHISTDEVAHTLLQRLRRTCWSVLSCGRMGFPVSSPAPQITMAPISFPRNFSH
jgi:dTDP-glucose 4,6-dehydratase